MGASEGRGSGGGTSVLSSTAGAATSSFGVLASEASSLMRDSGVCPACAVSSSSGSLKLALGSASTTGLGSARGTFSGGGAGGGERARGETELWVGEGDGLCGVTTDLKSEGGWPLGGLKEMPSRLASMLSPGMGAIREPEFGGERGRVMSKPTLFSLVISGCSDMPGR